VVFDSTGTALEDVAAAAMLYERARANGNEPAFDFAS
jgi:ornithine cyclodeaminase/alanine dehydrogenase-like protein (mu-crystallin family)